MENNASGGIGFCGLLTIVFIVLKLCGVISWSWIWVLAPLWVSVIPLIIVLLIFAICSIKRFFNRIKKKQ